MKNSRSKTDNTKTTTLLLLCKEDDLTSLLITNADCVNEKASCQKVARDILPKNVTIVKNVEVTEDLAREYFEILPTGSWRLEIFVAQVHLKSPFLLFFCKLLWHPMINRSPLGPIEYATMAPLHRALCCEKSGKSALRSREMQILTHVLSFPAPPLAKRDIRHAVKVRNLDSKLKDTIIIIIVVVVQKENRKKLPQFPAVPRTRYVPPRALSMTHPRVVIHDDDSPPRSRASRARCNKRDERSVLARHLLRACW